MKLPPAETAISSSYPNNLTRLQTLKLVLKIKMFSSNLRKTLKPIELPQTQNP